MALGWRAYKARDYAGAARWLKAAIDWLPADGKLSFDTLGGTRMACATAGGQIEGAYLDALGHIDHTGVQMRTPQELQLILDNGDKLVFARHAQ